MEAGLGRGRRAISRTVWHGFSTRGCGIPQHWPVLGPRSKTKVEDIAESRDHGLKTHATSAQRARRLHVGLFAIPSGAHHGKSAPAPDNLAGRQANLQ